MQMWLMMDLHDETRESSNGLALFDVSRRLWYKKMFNDEWSCSNSEWFLRAGDGGLLVYKCRKKGTLRVINPLTMQSHCLEDAVLTKKGRISFYMKRYHDDVSVHLKFDSEGKTFQVIIILANLYHLERKNFVVLIYKSATQRWEFREIDMGMTIMFSPSILIHKQKIYLFSEDGQNVGMYNLNEDSNTKFLYISGMQRVMHQNLGIVMCKGRMIMVCKGEPVELPPYTHTLIFYEFDEIGFQWRSKYEAVVSPKNLTQAICVGGDYIWVTEENEGYVEYIICIDIDTGELNIWPEGWEYNGRDCLSSRLSFCPCS
ncbi:hypothetical protein SUGI_0374490 [Cryptomeria japonica]|nr:hypothetical protein SUGI_0374490 [Cryptomeria japonica]